MMIHSTRSMIVGTATPHFLPNTVSLLCLFLILFVSADGKGCDDPQNAAFFVHGDAKLPASANACFNSCALGNCTGVLFQGERCIVIDKANYFGHLEERNYIEKQCVPKAAHKLIVSEWSDRILVDRSRSVRKADSKVDCLGLCANEKSFPCLSAMYYTESKDCLLNAASSTSAQLKMDTGGFKVVYMELHGLQKAVHCLNAFKMIAHDAMEIRGESRIYNGSDGLNKCIQRCNDCDFVLFNEIFSECYSVWHDPSGQVLDFVNDEYQVLTNACSNFRKDCNSRNSLYVSHANPDDKLKAECLEQCTMSEGCQYAYQSKDLSSCVLSRRKKALPLLVQRMCVDVGDLSDGSAILFDEMGGCKNEREGHLVGKDLELHECMQLCATHPTRSCESVSYTKLRQCYLHDSAVEAEANPNCSIFTLNVITFETDTTTTSTVAPGESKVKKSHKAKTFSTGSKKDQKKIEEKKLHVKSPPNPLRDVQIHTQCNFGHILVKLTSDEVLAGGEMYVRNGHTNCSTTISSNGHATLKIHHNDTSCPITRNGDVFESVVVVTQNLGDKDNATVITIDDQLFKVRCDYSNQKKAVAVAKTMNLRTTKFNNLDIYGKVNVKPMSMELRGKREIIKAQTVKIGQSLDLVFTAENSTSAKHVFVRQCTALDQDGDEKITLIKKGCATQNAKEYVLRDEIRETKTGFVLPFRAFRFKQGEAVKIECEVKYCKKCKKPKCTARNRRFVGDSEDVEEEGELTEDTEKVHAELLVQVTPSEVPSGYCLGFYKWVTLSLIASSIICSQLIALLYLCLRNRFIKHI